LREIHETDKAIGASLDIHGTVVAHPFGDGTVRFTKDFPIMTQSCPQVDHRLSVEDIVGKMQGQRSIVDLIASDGRLFGKAKSTRRGNLFPALTFLVHAVESQ